MLKKIISYFFVLNIALFNLTTFSLAEETNNTTTEQVTETTTKANSKANSETSSEVSSEDNSETSSEDNSTEVDDPLNLTAEAAIMIDADTGIILYDKDCHKRLYPASITKVMTTLLAIQNSKLDEVITHSHNAVYGIGPGSSHIGMREGEQITMEDALNGIMLASANEVCMAVAEHIDGDVDTFVNRMNKKAKELGALDTHFNNPHGFHDPEHYTTPYDMSLFMQAAIKEEEFVKLISTETYTIPKTNIVDEERPLTNKNKMIHKWSPYYYQYCVGSKTGFTDEAGNTLVTYGAKDGINLITVVMKDKGTATYTDTKTLLEYGFSIYEEKKLLSKEDYSTTIPVVQTYNDKTYELGDVTAILADDYSATVPNFIDTSKLELKPNIPKTVEPTIKAGDILGTVNIIYDSKILKSVDLVAQSDVEAIPEETLIKKEQHENFIKNILAFLKIVGIVFGGIVGLFILSIIVVRFIHYRKRKARHSRPRRKR